MQRTNRPGGARPPAPGVSAPGGCPAPLPPRRPSPAPPRGGPPAAALLPHVCEDVLEHEAGVQPAVAVLILEPAEQRRDGGRVVLHAYPLPVGGQHGVFFAPDAVPVDPLLRPLARALDQALDLLLLRVKIDQLVKRHAVERGEPFGLPDVRQRLVQLPFGDGLAADAQLFGHGLLRETALSARLMQAVSKAHCKRSLPPPDGRALRRALRAVFTSIARRGAAVHRPAAAVSPVFLSGAAGRAGPGSIRRGQTGFRPPAGGNGRAAGAPTRPPAGSVFVEGGLIYGKAVLCAGLAREGGRKAYARAKCAAIPSKAARGRARPRPRRS